MTRINVGDVLICHPHKYQDKDRGHLARGAPNPEPKTASVVLDVDSTGSFAQDFIYVVRTDKFARIEIFNWSCVKVIEKSTV